MSGAFPATTSAVRNRGARQAARIRWMVDEYIDFVGRTLRKAGVPPSELDDEVQRTFITLARRIDDVDLGAERSFLYQVAVNLASHSRRKLARRREVLVDLMPERIEVHATPEHLTHRKQMRRHLDNILDGMDESLRVVFLLHAFEGMDLAEIATQLRFPRGTVASRLRRARAYLREHVAAIEIADELGAPGAGEIEGPPLLRREKKPTALRRALLNTGVSVPASASASAKTLAVLGLA